MRKIIYFILAGLAAAGLASCDKQELKPTSEKDVYSIEIEEDLQTKVSASIPVGDEHIFHATLNKNGTPINCSSFDWTYPGTLVTQVASGSETNKDGITVGYLKVKGAKMGTGIVNATTDKNNTGGTKVTSNDVLCTVQNTISSITLTLVSSKVTVTESTTYTVTASYSDGTTKDVTSEATITSTNSKGLSASGGNITTSKVDGCFGERNITVSYGGKTDTKAFTVESDFIWCAVYGSYYTGGWGSEILINGAVRKTDFVSNPQVAGPGVGDYGSVSGIKVTRIDVNTKYTPSGECTYVFNNDGLTSMKYPGDIETIQVYYYGQLVQTIKLKYSK